MNYFWVFPTVFLCAVYFIGIFLVKIIVFDDTKDKVVASRNAVLWPIIFVWLMLKLLLIVINYILNSIAFTCGTNVGQKYEGSWLNKISNAAMDTLNENTRIFR